MKIAGTGSRKLANHPGLMHTVMLELRDMLLVEKAKHDKLEVISGMAEGFDEVIAYAAMIASVPFHAYIPNDGYGDYYWAKNSVTGRDRIQDWNKLISAAASVQYICNGIYQNGIHSNFVRNCAMVEDSDYLWALVNKEMVDNANSLIALKIRKLGPGTKHCVDYARSVGRDIRFIELDVDLN